MLKHLKELELALGDHRKELDRSRKSHQADVARLQLKIKDGELERSMLERQVQEQRHEVKALTRSVETGAKREAPPDARTTRELEASVRQFILAKRQRVIPPDKPPTMKDRRAHDKQQISATLREHQHLLTPF